MQITFQIARALSILAFLYYGITCLVTTHMVAEFERYRLARFRRVIGFMECLGAIGLLGGYFYQPLLIVGAAGLTFLMLMGIVTRIRIGDSITKTLPALVLFLLNGFVLIISIQQA